MEIQSVQYIRADHGKNERDSEYWYGKADRVKRVLTSPAVNIDIESQATSSRNFRTTQHLHRSTRNGGECYETNDNTTDCKRLKSNPAQKALIVKTSEAQSISNLPFGMIFQRKFGKAKNHDTPQPCHCNCNER